MWNPLPIYEWQQDCKHCADCYRFGVFRKDWMGRFAYEIEEMFDPSSMFIDTDKPMSWKSYVYTHTTDRGGEIMKMRTGCWGKAWENKRGNECQFTLRYNTHQWYLPLGVDIRGSLNWSITVGILCFRIHYSEFKYGWTPYSRSVGRIV